MIKAITFDLWNTLFENKSFSKIRIDFLVKLLSVKSPKYNTESIKDVYESSFKFLDYKENGFNFHHIYTEERIFSMVDKLKVQISEAEMKIIKKGLEEAMLKDPPLLKNRVKNTLGLLSKKYKLGLISNTGITPGYVITEVFNEYDILKYFQVTIFSDEIGYYKPHSLLFEKALNKLQTKPEHAAHVGDLLHTDIKGAKDYGMRAIWFNDTNQARVPEIQPDYEVKEMPEIVDIIKTL